jgi:transposase
MVDGSGDATALLRMVGFVVRAQVHAEGEWWLSVETVSALLGCPDCGVRATGHGRSVVQVRDVPISGVPVRLVWAKRRGKCRGRRLRAEHLHGAERPDRRLPHPTSSS